MFSSCFRDFISCCLSVNPTDRNTASQLLLHPFVVGGVPEVMIDSEEIEFVRKEELRDIFSAILAHIDFIKSNCYNNNVDNTFFEMDVSSASNLDILKALLFDKEYNYLQQQQQKHHHNQQQQQHRRFVRPRLITLARQLYIPLEQVVEEVQKFVSEIENKNNAM